MKILKSNSELKAHLSPGEEEVYLDDEWNKTARKDMTIDEIEMIFESPVSGCLKITGCHKHGEKSFIIKFESKLQSVNDTDYCINPCLILVGDARTGIITAMFSESLNEDKGNISTIPEIDWSEIQNCLKSTGDEQIWQLQKEGFQAFSEGRVTIPEVIYMAFKGFGDLHLKGAHKKDGEIYVFKIATGFPGNIDQGLQPTQGLMLAFDVRTANPLMILRDEGNLTDLRTAIAGRNAAQEMMSTKDLKGIGIIGTGVQARLQIGLLKNLYPDCNKLSVCGHTDVNTLAYAKEMTENGWDVSIKSTPAQVAETSNLIITTTPSEVALLDADDITMDNTVIIAIGADMPGKIELTAALLRKADNVLIDSIIQGKDHGNAAEAIKDGIIAETDLQEFGDFLKNGYKYPDKAHTLNLFLSSGIGVQDLQIVQAVITGTNH